ncbi:MAG: restriction endonuclease subunit S [Sulfurimonas sp.]
MKKIPQSYKQTKVGIVPEEWKEIALSSFINEKSVYCNDEKVSLGSLTIANGVIPKPARYNREHLVKDTHDAYKLIEINDFAYNPMNLRFGALALYKDKQQLKVSAYYNIFNVNEDIVNLEYIYAYLKSERIMFYYNRMATGSLEEKKRVHFKEFKKFIFPIPSLKEQEKIAEILTIWDDGISKHDELIKTKEELKKGLKQKLLSGKIRFYGFEDKWEFTKLGDLLDYIQPTKYLVANKDYDDSYKTPVLTAGKTFVLGHTKEEHGIFIDDLPVIIFDDFTTATKYVNFPFKAKSSAMKILKAKDKDVNVKLVFEMMQMINYSAYDHKRYWISEYQELEIKLPSLQEQQKIAEVLSNADKEIDLLKNELQELKEQQKGLMQKLLTGEVRVKI